MEAFLARHRLPEAFVDTATRYYMPFAKWLEQRLVIRAHPGFVLGINGAQGTGKSTLSSFLADYMQAEYGRTVIELSLDDLYLTSAERKQLALTVHPLLATRGVPGTHDVELGCKVIDRLRTLKANDRLPVPRFDKSVDDRVPESDWPVATGVVDLVILEGWCVGSVASSTDDLDEPVNNLEAEEDPRRDWRGYVNKQLATVYRQLFSRLDALLFLEAPNFDVIYQWRLEQEHKLRDATSSRAHGVLSDAQVARFIQHFERITRRNLEQLTASADVVIALGDDHQARSIRFG
jgi:D-glycerate 3-kinase